jgi:hypothetical protein
MAARLARGLLQESFRVRALFLAVRIGHRSSVQPLPSFAPAAAMPREHRRRLG